MKTMGVLGIGSLVVTVFLAGMCCPSMTMDTHMKDRSSGCLHQTAVLDQKTVSVSNEDAGTLRRRLAFLKLKDQIKKIDDIQLLSDEFMHTGIETYKPHPLYLTDRVLRL